MRVFISHAHDDADLARLVRQLLDVSLGLTENEITCTSEADYGLLRGESLKEQIRIRLSSAKALFLLATPASRQKEWVNFECGFADAARAKGDMHFYVLVPVRSYLASVPEPHRDRVAVTMSNGADLHAFVKQLRQTLGLDDRRDLSADYVSALLDLEQHCSALERERFVADQHQASSQSRRRGRAAIIAMLMTTIAGGYLALQSGRQNRELITQYQQAETAWSQQLKEADAACEVDLKRLPFSGLVHDAGSLRPLPCTRVNAVFSDSTTGKEKSVPESCNPDGTFTFAGERLGSDPRQPIELEVDLVRRGVYKLHINRSQATLAIPILGGQR